MLELKNITVAVDTDAGEKVILNDVNLQVPDNKFTVITGPNGGGKSTLAKVIMGIMEPTEGSVIFNGKDITKASITERAQEGISFSFQQPVRFKGLTVADLMNLAVGEQVPCGELCEYLTKVGLCARSYINRPIDDSLSGGEMKRIEIAVSLARQAELSIFDEPEAGIDLWSFQNLITTFQELREDFGGSILLISHQERILEIADEIIVIADGVITHHGSKEEILPYLLRDDTQVCDLCPKTGKEMVS